ncbi:MAG: sulfatase [Verrucomicrobiota bacterium]
MRKRSLFLLGIISAFACAPLAKAVADKRPNVLFIAIDDLRSQLGCYGYEDMVTPHIDQLAREGILFEQHYVSQPICIPSRAALLTSLRSERTKSNGGWARVPGVQTIGRTFGDAGYFTASLGKIWHLSGGRFKESVLDRFDYEWGRSLDSRYATPELSAIWERENENSKKKKGQLPAAESPIDVPDEAYGDGLLAQEAIRVLDEAAQSGQPFFIMVGFYKPHLPFNAPKKYWDLYDPDNLPGTPELESLPEGASQFELRKRHDLWGYQEGFTFNNPPEGEEARHLRHAYAACVSFVDAQVGKVLAELDRLGLRDDTIVVLWSDHGYQLGHLGSWTKLTNFEMTAGSPLIISAPGYERGLKTKKIVESVDLFPTLLDLCGIAELQVTDGVTLRPLLEDPSSSEWNEPAFHSVNRGGKVGRAVRDARFRYIEWRDGWEDSDQVLDVELYDYAKHPEERINVADNPEYRGERDRLAELLWTWQ